MISVKQSHLNLQEHLETLYRGAKVTSIENYVGDYQASAESGGKRKLLVRIMRKGNFCASPEHFLYKPPQKNFCNGPWYGVLNICMM